MFWPIFKPVLGLKAPCGFRWPPTSIRELSPRKTVPLLPQNHQFPTQKAVWLCGSSNPLPLGSGIIWLSQACVKAERKGLGSLAGHRQTSKSMAMSWRRQGKDLGSVVGQGRLPAQAARRDMTGIAAISNGWRGRGRGGCARDKGRATELAILKPFLFILHFGTNYSVPAVTGCNRQATAPVTAGSGGSDCL